MSAAEKAEVRARVASSSVPKREVLSELGVPRSTDYRWLRGREQQGLEDQTGGGKLAWNRRTSREVHSLLPAARDMPELNPRQLAAWTTDTMGFCVSASPVYRVLGREGLVKRAEMRLAAGKEYHRKTTGPHQMWATDASSFRVVGWGYSSLVTVMDDSSRFILAAPFHPQTNGKLERYHQTLKRDVNQLPYELPSDLEAAIVAFVSSYTYRRYHKALGNVTPSDMLRGRREDILRRLERLVGAAAPVTRRVSLT